MVAGFFGIFSRFHRLQLLPISQEKESARGRSSSSGQLAGGLRRRPPARLWVWRAWPLGGRLLARLPLLVSCVARSGVCCLGGFVARRVPPRCGRFSVVRLARAVRGAGCATACPWVSGCGALWVGAGFGASCAAASCPGGLRGLCRPGRFPAGPVLVLGARSSRPAVGAACPPSWPSASGIASLPPVRACGLWPLVVGGLPVRPWVPGCLSWLLPRSTSRGFCPSWAAAPVALWTRWTEQPPAHLTTPLYRKLAIPARLCHNYIANKMIARNPRHLRQVNRGFRHVRKCYKKNICAKKCTGYSTERESPLPSPKGGSAKR